jgi:hypothetical protein
MTTSALSPPAEGSPFGICPLEPRCSMPLRARTRVSR